MKSRVLALAGLLVVMMVGSASADVIQFTVTIQSGNISCPGCQSVYMNSGANVASAYGAIGANNGNQDILFSATNTGGASNFDAANGFAQVAKPTNGDPLNSVTMTFLTFTADAVTFSLFLEITGNDTTNVRFDLFGPNTTQATHNQSIDKNNNIMFISSNDSMNKLVITTTAGDLITAVKQIEVDPHQQVVPEPASMVLLGSGLLGAGRMLRKKLKK